MGKVKLVIDAGERDERIGGFFELARRWLLPACRFNCLSELVARELALETVENRLGSFSSAIPVATMSRARVDLWNTSGTVALSGRL